MTSISQVEVRYSCFILIYLFSVDVLLDDFLAAESPTLQSDVHSPVLTSERASTITSPIINHSNANACEAFSDDRPELPSSFGLRF